jgi:hypothetical protein
MSALEVLLAVVGLIVTALVVAGMILLTPRGQVSVHIDGDDPQRSNLSGTEAPRAVRASREPVPADVRSRA